ncbi:MAG: glycosyl hydrolase [Bacteroidota bacterium]|nr:glycosyl hydrolase [Bacteroidota bacterium]
MTKKILFLAIIIGLAANLFAQKGKSKSASTDVKTVKLTSAALGKMEARHIGPAVTGGRCTSVDGVNSDPRILYVGTAGGGVWKTTNGGAEFKSVFDKHCQSIGAIAIDQTNPDVVWVGTGESNMRNTVSVGNGIYKTTDGGENWVFTGLPNSEHISKVVIHPNDPNTVFVAVPGKLWSNSSERGLYKTTDGGKTWEKILFANDSTGCADFAINPKDPNTMYATMWQFRRKPYAFNSGGPGCSIMKSTDGGKTWRKIQKGLSTDTIGRAAVAISPSSPDNMVAIVESKKTGLYISADGGETWKEQSADDNVCARPFYFSCVVVDPLDAKRVYRPAFEFSYSEDGGYSWVRSQNSQGWLHSDMHGLWINPKNTSQMYVCTDGGVYMSVDKGNNWIYLNSIPVAQLYHVQVDEQEPYNVYCGLQDNGSWRAPSQSPGAIKNSDWRNVGGGDGFWVQPDGEDNQVVYSEYQGGHISRVELKPNQSQDVQPKAGEQDPKFRFNWNTPIVRSPNNKKRLYMGAQFLFKSEDKGLSWAKISPDLTTNDLNKLKQEESGGLTNDNTSAENHCTIFTIAESPLDEKMIWVGTDDGNLQLSLDAGKTWTNMANNYKGTNEPAQGWIDAKTKAIAHSWGAEGIPAQTWISSIEPSRFDKNVVYVTFDNHMYGDVKTYVAKSSDMGKTWKMFSSSAFKGYAHKIKEDIVSKDLLFLGTEMGLYVSIDGGNNWVQMKAHIPEYALVRDMTIERKTNDLVVATHGRGILIVDDISPLRKINEQLLNADVAIIPSRPTAVGVGHYGDGWPDAGGYLGPNSSEEAHINYYLKQRVNSGAVKVEIYDDKGNFLIDLPGTKRKGINMITWNMRIKPPHVAEGGSKADFTSTIGPMVMEGKYKVKVIVGDKSAEGELDLIADAKSTSTAKERELNHEAVMRSFRMEEELASLMDSVIEEQKLIKDLKDASPVIKEYYDSLEVIRAELVPVKEGRTVIFVDEEKMRDKISDIYAGVSFYQGSPTSSQIDGLNKLQRDMNGDKTKLDQRKNSFRPKVRAELKRLGKNQPY